ncbi:antibiotic acetyltransferase [Shinella sp. 838]|uniref:antibiotic acetyltransferase n=1 Tax=Shinella sp. 838 TaxID=3038164 RepID=UPI0024152E15|nr:antibiotic acetyltransferase [Shinella sp. 838]MDG4676201.1 antibiotic acetyltransferase [Shinella sp. 838]
MDKKLLTSLREHRVSFHGTPSESRFGIGRVRVPIVFEPFVELRGGAFDIRRIDAFSYLGGRGSRYRHVGRIGRFCSLGPGVVCGAPEHDYTGIMSHSLMTGHWNAKWPEMFDDFGIEANQIAQGRQSLAAATEKRRARITIGNDVWIGDGAFLSRGVTIGDGAVVAARATVVSDVLPYTVVGGTPAKLIKSRFPPEIVDRLLASRWWDYGLAILAGTEWSNIEKCLEVIEHRIRDGIEPYRPRKLRIYPDDSIEYFDRYTPASSGY